MECVAVEHAKKEGTIGQSCVKDRIRNGEGRAETKGSDDYLILYDPARPVDLLAKDAGRRKSNLGRKKKEYTRTNFVQMGLRLSGQPSYLLVQFARLLVSS